MPVVTFQQASDEPLLLDLLLGHLRRHKDWFVWLLWSWKAREARSHDFSYCSRFQHLLRSLAQTTMEMPWLTRVLAKLPVTLPDEAKNLIIQCLRKKHPTALLISQLCFDREEEDVIYGIPASLSVSGPSVRLPGDTYGHLLPAEIHFYLRRIGDGACTRNFSYDTFTGRPRRHWSTTFDRRRPSLTLDSDSEDEIERWLRYV